MEQVLKLPETGPELRALREEAGVLASDLTDALGMRNERISRIEKGREPVPDGLAERYRQAVVQLVEQRREKVRELVPATP